METPGRVSRIGPGELPGPTLYVRRTHNCASEGVGGRDRQGMSESRALSGASSAVDRPARQAPRTSNDSTSTASARQTPPACAAIPSRSVSAGRRTDSWAPTMSERDSAVMWTACWSGRMTTSSAGRPATRVAMVWIACTSPTGGSIATGAKPICMATTPTSTAAAATASPTDRHAAGHRSLLGCLPMAEPMLRASSGAVTPTSYHA